MKNILILTAGYGEGHNSAARGIRDGLRKIAPHDVHVELHDLFADTYGVVNDWARVLYMGMINRTPRVWGVIYRWLDRQTDFVGDFRVFFPMKSYLRRLLERLQPEVIVSVYPAYSHMLDEMFGRGGAPQYKRVVVVTDSISVNAIWYQCSADYFLLPNEVSADVLLHAGIPAEKVRTFGFPVSPVFAQPGEFRPPPSDENGRRVLYTVSELGKWKDNKRVTSIWIADADSSNARRFLGHEEKRLAFGVRHETAEHQMQRPHGPQRYRLMPCPACWWLS